MVCARHRMVVSLRLSDSVTLVILRITSGSVLLINHLLFWSVAKAGVCMQWCGDWPLL